MITVSFDVAVLIVTILFGVVIAELLTRLTKLVGKTVFKSDPKVLKTIKIINVLIWLIMTVIVVLDLSGIYYSLSIPVEAYLRY